MSITTKTGDKGETGLYTGERVSKDSLRVETYGAIDELDSVLAMSRAFAKKKEVVDCIFTLQKNMGLLMADFASIGKEPHISAKTVQEIEHDIAELEKRLPPLTRFIIPGDTQGGAMLDLARTAARRAERNAVRLAKDETIHESDMQYLNRLSDYIFMLMRLEEESEAHKL